jgi:hypothetical protein
MNIYAEFKRDRLRIKTGDEEIEIRISTDFYTPIPGTESFEMFRDKETNTKLKDFIDRQRNNLGLLEKVNYWFFRNRVLVLVDKEVQNLATIGQLYSYGTLNLDGRIVSIIKKPDTFDSDKLENIESIQTTSINRRGKIIGDVVISKLT